MANTGTTGPDQEGNVLRVPGVTQGNSFKPDEILASYARFTQKGVTLKQGQGVLATGTVLVRDNASKKYVAGTGAGAKGVLRKSVDTSDEDKLGNIVMSGILYASKLTGMDSAAVTALNGRLDTDRDWFVF